MHIKLGTGLCSDVIFLMLTIPSHMHDCVCRAQEVVGIISREDLLSETLERRIQNGHGQFDTAGTLASSSAVRHRYRNRSSESPSPMRRQAHPPSNHNHNSTHHGHEGVSRGGRENGQNGIHHHVVDVSQLSRMSRVPVGALPRASDIEQRLSIEMGGTSATGGNRASTGLVTVPSVRPKARSGAGSGSPTLQTTPTLWESGQQGIAAPQLLPLANDGQQIALQTPPESRGFKSRRSVKPGKAMLSNAELKLTKDEKD
jgi:hypothetical protein